MRRRVLRRLIWVYTVCLGLSVRIRRVSTDLRHYKNVSGYPGNATLTKHRLPKVPEEEE